MNAAIGIVLAFLALGALVCLFRKGGYHDDPDGFAQPPAKPEDGEIRTRFHTTHPD